MHVPIHVNVSYNTASATIEKKINMHPYGDAALLLHLLAQAADCTAHCHTAGSAVSGGMVVVVDDDGIGMIKATISTQTAYLSTYAPPAWVLQQALHFQIPTAERRTAYCGGDMVVVMQGSAMVVQGDNERDQPHPKKQLFSHFYLAAKAAKVLGVLCNLNLLDLLPQAGTITSTILAHDADLLCAL